VGCCLYSGSSSGRSLSESEVPRMQLCSPPLAERALLAQQVSPVGVSFTDRVDQAAPRMKKLNMGIVALSTIWRIVLYG
jgi:hypothetical protein